MGEQIVAKSAVHRDLNKLAAETRKNADGFYRSTSKSSLIIFGCSILPWCHGSTIL